MQYIGRTFSVIYIQLFLWKYSETAAPVINNLPNATDLLEDTSTEDLLYSLDVTDADGDAIKCSFGAGSNPGVGTSRFNVRYIAGTTNWGIYTVAGAAYDYNSQPDYSLVIDCDANGDTNTNTFTVNLVENQVPVINNLPDSRTLTVSTAGIGDIIFTVNVTDAENDLTTLSISCGPVTPACPFEIFNSGAIVLNADISAATVTGYDVTVSVSDNGGSGTSKVLSVLYSGINSPPTIQNLGTTFSVPENSALGSTLETTSCTDSDVTDTLAYSMSCTPSSGLTYFQINSSSGVISTSPSSSINYEYLHAAGSTSFTCTVTCSDGETSVTATVDFDVTGVNESPSFSQNGYSISADEGAAGTALQTSGYNIIDEDSGDTKTFSIDCGTFTGYFSIDTGTGILSFGSNYDVDDGSRPTSVSCIVTVTDSGGLTGTTTLSIAINNINDNSPVFVLNSYSWHVSEGAAVGTTVGAVSATDADIGTYGAISYSLNQTTLSTEYFGIDQTGTVFIQNAIAALGGGVTVTFDVIATDGGGTETRVTATVVTVATTTTTTTTTTDRFKTFFDDGRNIGWFTACCIIIGITAVVIVGMCCSYTGSSIPNARRRKKQFNFRCCKCWQERSKGKGNPTKVKIIEPIKEHEAVPRKEPTLVPIDKPRPEPEGFQFWSTTMNQWHLS